MAYIVLVVNVPSQTTSNLNSQAQLPTKTFESVQGAINLLQAIGGGVAAGTVQIVTRGTDPSVTTDGDPNSQSNVYNLS